MTHDRPTAVSRHFRTLFDAGAAAGMTDSQLLERFATAAEAAHAAEAAFVALVGRHGPMVLGVCRRALHDPRDVEDAFQATFFVLVRKAGSVRADDSLGRWLFGVARRVAARARADARRRRAREAAGAAGPRPAAGPGCDLERAELLAAVDDELGRLPEKFRAPVVLCYLEGLSHAEAARRLRWPVGSVKGRLAQARELLRDRLVRRGLAPAAATLGAGLAEEARATVPASLAEATARAAARLMAGETAGAAAATASVAALMKGALKAMLWTRLRTAAVVVLAVAATTAAAGGLARAGRDGPTEAAAAANGRGDGPGADTKAEAEAVAQARADGRGRPAAGKPAGAEASLEGTAVDGEGRPLPGVDYYLSHGLDPAGGVPTLARATTDADGRYRLEGPGLEPAWRKVGHVSRALFAYRRGLALVATVVPPPDPEVARRPLGPARRRTVTLRGADGRPIAGARIAPCSLTPVPSNYYKAVVPDELADRLEATTDADGRASLDCLAPASSLLDLRVAIPGAGTQVVAPARPTAKDEAVTIDLKPAGRLAGRVRRDDGRAAAGATVEVWSRAGNLVMPVRFEAGPIRTDAHGSFRTPPALLAGIRYRALIRAEGFAPALTDYILPTEGAGSETALPDVALAPLRSIAGRVADRRGRPVAGAVVVAGGAGVATTTDDGGRFRLDGVPRDRALLVVRRDGFRVDGRMLGPGEGDDAVEFALARFDEPPARVMATLPYPIPPEERTRLARRMLDPLLEKAIARGDDPTKHWVLRALMTFDPAAALDLLGRINFQDQDYSRGFLGGELVRRLVPEDPDRATAVAEGIAPATWRAGALLRVADRLPADQRARRLVLVDRALAAARAEADPEMRLIRIGDVADHLLDLGEAVQAKALFDEGRALYAGLAFKYTLRPIHFLIRLGRADLPSARELIEKIPSPGDRALIYGNIAARLAASDPVEAERLLGIAVGLGAAHGVALRVCQEMARADLPRARRIALARATAFDRAEALLFAAGSLPASGRAAARGLVREAMAEADGPSDGPLSAAASLPALWPALMPLVEPFDPALVPELFWRGVAALAPENDPRVDFGLDDVLRLAPTLARYDRTVAAALFEPVMRAKAAGWKKANETPITVILALVAIDPRRAVEAVEAMPEPDGTNTRGANWARIRLAMLLGKDDEAQLWRGPSGTASSVLGQDDILH